MQHILRICLFKMASYFDVLLPGSEWPVAVRLIRFPMDEYIVEINLPELDWNDGVIITEMSGIPVSGFC